VFIERLKEGQKAFLNNFLLPEVKSICEAMNFKNVPELEFEEINLTDTSQRERVFLRLAELGILTPDETFTAIESGVLPDKDSNIVDQGEYKKNRDKGLFVPLLGGGADAQQDGGSGRPPGSKSPQTTKKVSPIGTGASLNAGRVVELSLKAAKARELVEAALKKEHKLETLNESQLEVAALMTKSLIINENDKEWFDKASKYATSIFNPDEESEKQIQLIAARADLDEYNSIIVWKAGYNTE